MSLKIKDIELFVELEDTDSQSVVSGGKGIQQSGIQQSGSASGRNLSSSTSISI